MPGWILYSSYDASPSPGVLLTARHFLSSRGAEAECSPRRQPWESARANDQPRRGGRSSYAPTGLVLLRLAFPGLAPGATFCRRSAAKKAPCHEKCWALGGV